MTSLTAFVFLHLCEQMSPNSTSCVGVWHKLFARAFIRLADQGVRSHILEEHQRKQQEGHTGNLWIHFHIHVHIWQKPWNAFFKLLPTISCRKSCLKLKHSIRVRMSDSVSPQKLIKCFNGTLWTNVKPPFPPLLIFTVAHNKIMA